MRSLLSLLAYLIGIACVVVFLSFTVRGTSARTEIRVGLIDPWLVRTSRGTTATIALQPRSWSALAGAGALVFLVGGRLGRRRKPEPETESFVPEPARPENTPLDGL